MNLIVIQVQTPILDTGSRFLAPVANMWPIPGTDVTDTDYVCTGLNDFVNLWKVPFLQNFLA